jgi:RecB family exonuclease
LHGFDIYLWCLARGGGERSRAGSCRTPLKGTLHVYPTALKAGQADRAQARTVGAILGARSTTFPQLTEALAHDLGPPPRALEPELAAVVLEHVVATGGLRGEFVRGGRGLLRELLAAIGEMRSAYLAPADVARLAVRLPPGPGASRLGALARIYDDYDAALRRLGAVDRHGRDWLVCERLAAAEADGRRPRLLDGVERIVFAEIYDFSVLQFLIATSLIRLVGDAELVVFAHPENVDATRFLDRTWNRFVGAADIADQVLPGFVVRGGRQGSLAAALRGVFATDRPPPAPGDGSIRLVVAPSRYHEVESAAREIRTRLEAGAAPERLALLARDMTLYGDLIEDVCRRFRIPVYFRKGRPLLATGLVKACLNVVRCVTEGFPRRRLEALLDSDYFGVGGPRLVGALRDAGFVSERARPLAECIAHATTLLELRGDAVEQRRAALEDAGAAIEGVMAIVRPLAGRRHVGAHVAALRRALRRLRLRPVGGEAVLPAAVRRDARAAVGFEETLNGIAGIGRALSMAPLDLDAFLGLLLAALEGRQVEDPAEHAGSVRALSVLDARGLDFDVVHLLGLDDGTFPAPRRESPLLPDGLKRAVNPLAAELLRQKLGARAGALPLGGCLRTAREASLEDPFLFFLALSMAERELVLSCPASDERGNPTIVSPFVDEVAACLADGLPRRDLPPTAFVPAPGECCEPAELVARAARDRWARGPRAFDRLTPALRDALPNGPARLATIDRRAVIEERRARYFLSPRDGEAKARWVDVFVGRLGGERALLEQQVGAMKWSPSRLERLGACGFRFFAGYVLGLREEAEPELEVAANEQGTVFHRVLEELFERHPRLPADPDAARALVHEFVAGVRATGAGTIAAKDPIFLDVAWSPLEATLNELLDLEREADRRRDAEGLVVERALEQELEVVVPDPAGGAPLVLHGKPDRVELEQHGGTVTTLRVLDYKVTKDTRRFPAMLDPERALGRTAFQIPVYLLAAIHAARGRVTESTALEGGYLAVLAPGKQKRQLRVLPFPVVTEVVPAHIRALVARARAGHFDVDPDPCDQYCAYRAVCRYQPPPLEDDEIDA